MNRRRILSSVHRSIARHADAPAVERVDHSTIERMSMADLDKVGPRLVTTPPVERALCIYCSEAPASEANAPYCSITCALGAENS